MIMEAPIPARDKEAMSVVFLPRLRGPLPFRSACIQRRERNVGPTLIGKDPLLGLALLHLLSPAGSFLLVAFAGCQELFFRVQPSRWIMRLIVEVLTPMPYSLFQSVHGV